MAFSYLDEETIFQTFKESKQFMLPWFKPLDELERIAGNKPHPEIDPAYPKTTDGTTASIVNKAPKRVIQQLPTGKVVSDTNDWLTIVASFIYTNCIIPHANFKHELLQKCWEIVRRGLIYGSCPTLVPFIINGQYIGTDLDIPYIKDVFIMSGKISDKDSPVMFVRAWYQPSDIDAIIEKENTLAKKAKDRGEKYESTWDTAELQAIKDEMAEKDATSTDPAEKANGSRTSAIEIIHAFQTGVGAMFYSFHADTEKIVRRKKNKDPRGVIPIHFFYVDIDYSNPLGRGYVELVAPLQNLIDAEMQMYQYNRALMLNPPLVKRGTFDKKRVKFVPNAVIDVGSDEHADVKPLTIDTSALQNFSNNYGLMKSQILNLLSSPDASISSEVGNPGFSKTDAGVKSQAANVSIDDNYLRKQFEAWFADWSETAINLYFAERSGVEEIQLDDETAERLHDVAPDMVSADNKITINYDDVTEMLKFEVDASTSNAKDSQAQLEALDGLLQRLESNPALLQIIPRDKIIAAWNAVVMASGVEDPEKLKISEEEVQQHQQMMQQQMQAQAAQASQAAPQPEAKPVVPYDKAPEDVKRQMELKDGYHPSQMPSPVQQELDQKQQQLDQSHIQGMANVALKATQPTQAQQQGENPQENAGEPQGAENPAENLTEDDHAFAQQLAQLGYSPEKVGQALAMLHHGIDNQEILAMLEA